MISDGKARRIASEWHGGQTSPLYSFASTGATNGLSALVDEIDRCIYANHDATTINVSQRELCELRDYINTVGRRGVQAGWADVWEDTCIDCGTNPAERGAKRCGPCGDRFLSIMQDADDDHFDYALED